MDKDYLREIQYKSGSNLATRIALHERFGKNKEGWHHWLLTLSDIKAGESILEVGCGTADMWRKYASLVPSGCKILLTDFSEGMVASAHESVKDSHLPIEFQVMDAQHLDIPDSSIDLALANHMLYHVPDPDKAYAELRRVLKSTGRLIASTNGLNHVKEVDDLIERFAPNVARDQNVQKFGLENGEEQLLKHFSRVERLDHEDELIVTEAEPLIAYIISLSGVVGTISPSAVADMTAYVSEQIKRDGAFRVQKQSGAFRVYP